MFTARSALLCSIHICARNFSCMFLSVRGRSFTVNMGDIAEVAPPATAPAPASTKKAKSSTKKPRAKPVHPRTSEMVSNAIKSLKERGGSSLQAIKKYISANYKVDSEKLAPFIKKYLKAAVASGELVQTKGKGASGSFKLSSGIKPEKSAAASAPGRAKGGSGSAGPKEKKQRAKTKSPKKAAAKKTSVKKKPVSPVKTKKPSKAKKAAKVPTKKPKAPRPKTAAKSKAPKKGSPKKK